MSREELKNALSKMYTNYLNGEETDEETFIDIALTFIDDNNEEPFEDDEQLFDFIYECMYGEVSA